MKNILIAEFIGTYFLYLIIGMCITPPGAAELTPLAVAIGLSALVYSCGHISKAHFNPATTLTYFAAGSLPKRRVFPYILITLSGALAAGLSIVLLNPEGLAAVEPATPQLARIFLAEALFTFALMWVILNVAIAKGTQGNGFYGLAIGAVVGAGAYAVGPISFAAFNPAVTLSLCLNGFIPWNLLPLYLLAQSGSALAAGYLFRRMGIANPDELVQA